MSSLSDQAFSEVLKLLSVSKKYPWKTAKYLTNWLSRERQISISVEELEKSLLGHARERPRLLRYSSFPARTRLDLLWGHIDIVKDFPGVANPHLEEELKTDILEEFEKSDIPPDATWCFLSHSFLDLKEVVNIRNTLIRRGYGVWLAEVEILKDEMITHRVKEGLDQSQIFITFMTKQSIASRWVLKEALAGVMQWKLPPVIFIDSHEKPLIHIFSSWISKGWDHSLQDQLLNFITDQPMDAIAPTDLSSLLISAFRNVPKAERKVILWPPRELERDQELFARIEEVLPEL